MTDSLKEMAAQLRRLIEDKAATIRNMPEFTDLLKLHQGLNGLESAMGEADTPLSEFLGFAIASQSGSTSRTGALTVRPDEFFKMDGLEAAKTYLKKHRDARPFQEILTAIKNGGAKIEDEEKLKTGLGRSTLDVVKFGEHYGWLDNYPEEKAKRTKGLRRGSGTNGEKKQDEPASGPVDH